MEADRKSDSVISVTESISKSKSKAKASKRELYLQAVAKLSKTSTPNLSSALLARTTGITNQQN
jgi:hypothetical protein